MTDVEARFEFRVWGMELDDAVGRLRSLADKARDWGAPQQARAVYLGS